jgi:serine protease
MFRGGIDGIGVTSAQPKVYLVFWGSQWGAAATDGTGSTTFSNDPQSGAPALQQFFRGLGTNKENWSTVLTQYCDGPLVPVGASSCPAGAPHVGYPARGVLAGVWYDNASPQPKTPDGTALAAEAVRAATHFGNLTPASNRYAQYMVLSPTQANPDRWLHSKFCAWHSFVRSANGDVAFSNVPYVMDAGPSCGSNFVNAGPDGLRDGYTLLAGHEYAETVTDQNPGGGWTSASGAESSDECQWIRPGQPGGSGNIALSTGSFPVQANWSNASNQCELEAAL